jgi:hypothetical protein
MVAATSSSRLWARRRAPSMRCTSSLRAASWPAGSPPPASPLQRGPVTGQHALEERRGAAFGLGGAAAEADQATGAVLAGRERAQMRAQVAQLDAARELAPLRRVGSAEAVGPVEVGVGRADGLAVLVD